MFPDDVVSAVLVKGTKFQKQTIDKKTGFSILYLLAVAAQVCRRVFSKRKNILLTSAPIFLEIVI